jgi:Flp pilus assembly pilin Flp
MRQANGWFNRWRARGVDEQGATSVEYALLVGFIAAVAVAAFAGLGVVVLDFFTQGSDAF